MWPCLRVARSSAVDVSPQDAGLPRATLADLKGGDAEENAGALRRLFDGEHGAYRDIVLSNTAAALIVAGKAADLRSGAAVAARNARQRLRQAQAWREFVAVDEGSMSHPRRHRRL